jgi:hypothetical protein
MDGFSLIIGGIIGMLAGWAFSRATVKQQEASLKLEKASLVTEEITKKKGEATINKASSFTDTVQGVFFYVLGLCAIFIMALIIFNSMI